jgi:hypothetical protein
MNRICRTVSTTGAAANGYQCLSSSESKAGKNTLYIPNVHMLGGPAQELAGIGHGESAGKPAYPPASIIEYADGFNGFLNDTASFG